MLTPQQFVEKWENVQQKESAVYISHFEDVCRLVDHATPTDSDSTGDTFSFQRALKKGSGAQGFRIPSLIILIPPVHRFALG